MFLSIINVVMFGFGSADFRDDGLDVVLLGSSRKSRRGGIMLGLVSDTSQALFLGLSGLFQLVKVLAALVMGISGNLCSLGFRGRRIVLLRVTYVVKLGSIGADFRYNGLDVVLLGSSRQSRGGGIML